MNSDKSQHSKDNWVQKTVRNLEGMNKARHASVDQSNEKPPSDYLKSKRNSAPSPLSRQRSLPRPTGKERQTAGLRLSTTPKSRSISPLPVNSTVKTAKSDTAKPEPPVRKSSLTSPTVSRLVSNRLLQFQSSHSETEKIVKPCSSSRSISSDSSQDVNGTLPIIKTPSPTRITSGNARANSLKRTASDGYGRPPRPSSYKTSNGLNAKSSVSKASTSKVFSPSHQASKPSIKPKPTSVASASKTKSDLRTSSRPNSARAALGKSPAISASSRQPIKLKVPKSRSPILKVPHSSSVEAVAETTADTVETKVVKQEGSKQEVESKVAHHMVSQVKKRSNGTRSPINRRNASKVASPKISRKQFSSGKSSTTTKSPARTSNKTSSAPNKPKPPPILSPKPILSESMSHKTKIIPESASTVLAGEQKSSSTNETLASSKPDQGNLSSTEASTSTNSTSKSKDEVDGLDTVVSFNTVNRFSFDNNDNDIYDDVIVPSTTVTASRTNDSHAMNKSELNVKECSSSNVGTGDDVVHAVGGNVSTTKYVEDLNTDLSEVKGDTNSNDTAIKIPADSCLTNEEKQANPQGSPQENIATTISGPLVQESTVSTLTVEQTKEELAVSCNDDEIYDDVVVQNTAVISLQENSPVSIDNQAVATTAVTMVASNSPISMDEQSPSEVVSVPAKSKGSDDFKHDEISSIPPSKTPSPHQQAQLIESEAFYDDIVHQERVHPRNRHTANIISDEDFQVAELCVSPRQSRVASFQRAGDKSFGYRDSGLGIEAYYDKVGHSDDVTTEPAFYDQIGEGREQLETVSSTEDVLHSESSAENVLVVKDLEPPALPPRSEDMINEVNESKNKLTGRLLEASAKVVEASTVESGFEDHCFDSYCNEESKQTVTKTASKVKPDPLVITQISDNSPPPLPPRRPHSTQIDADEISLKSPSSFSHRASSGSPQLTNSMQSQRQTSTPQLIPSPKEFAGSSSSLAPSHSAVSIISGRSEDRNATDGGSDISSLADVGGEFAPAEHKREKSKFSLTNFRFMRKKSDKRKKTESAEDYEQVRPRASSMGQSLNRKKSSRHAVKKKGSVPPETQFLPSETDYSLPDPLYFTADTEYDNCTVIKNNWKSPPPDSNHVLHNFNTDAAPVSTTTVSSDDKPELLEEPLNNIKEVSKSMESLGSFTQNFEDSSGWFDDIYDMVANSAMYASEMSEVKLTVTEDNNGDIYDVVAVDLPDEDKLVATGSSSNLNRRVSSSVDSSGSFDSLEENEDDHVSPLASDLSSTMKGRSLPQRSVHTKVASPTRPRSYLSNLTQTVEIVKDLQLSRSVRLTEDIKEDVMETELVYADAVWDYDPTEEGDLKFYANDVIEITDMTNNDWWLGYINNTSGWFPASYVRIRVGQEEVENIDANGETSIPQLQRVETNDGSVSSGRSFRRTVRRASADGILDKKLSRSEYRAKIVEEIVSTERTYVKYMEDVVEGYMERCIGSPHLFTADRIEVIFANIRELLQFQKKFLAKLEACVTPADLSQSQIGGVFTDHQSEFSVYSEYCNNHPYAVNEMNELQEDPQYVLFFESCRLLRNLGDLPLEAFLLKPVQKICKYPLQLSELLKYTDSSHPDCVFVKDAVEAMKNVASLINSRKRRIENLYKLALWQRAIENWKGDHVVETSSDEVFSGDLYKISKGHSQERHFTLFDHQLIYCKREAIGHKLQYRGRIIMDNCKIIDLVDGEETYGGNPVKNAWKINNETKNKWYILYSKDPSIKEAWMDAFSRERQRVKDDATSNFNIRNRLRKMAIAQADKSTKKEIKTKRSVLQESIEQYGIKQRSSSVFQASPNIQRKKGSKKKKTKRSAS